MPYIIGVIRYKVDSIRFKLVSEKTKIYLYLILLYVPNDLKFFVASVELINQFRKVLCGVSSFRIRCCHLLTLSKLSRKEAQVFIKRTLRLQNYISIIKLTYISKFVLDNNYHKKDNSNLTITSRCMHGEKLSWTI